MNWDACWLSAARCPKHQGAPAEVAAWELAQAGSTARSGLRPGDGGAFEVTGDVRGARPARR